MARSSNPISLQPLSGLIRSILQTAKRTACWRRAGRKVIVLDPSSPATGFNALDWIGRFGGTKEEDIVAVATWIMTDNAHCGWLS